MRGGAPAERGGYSGQGVARRTVATALCLPRHSNATAGRRDEADDSPNLDPGSLQ